MRDGGDHRDGGLTTERMCWLFDLNRARLRETGASYWSELLEQATHRSLDLGDLGVVIAFVQGPSPWSISASEIAKSLRRVMEMTSDAPMNRIWHQIWLHVSGVCHQSMAHLRFCVPV